MNFANIFAGSIVGGQVNPLVTFSNGEYVFCIYTVLVVAHRQLMGVPIGVLVVAVAIWMSVMVSIRRERMLVAPPGFAGHENSALRPYLQGDLLPPK
jgi:hypothetical protein